jgi:hypothetical protein
MKKIIKRIFLLLLVLINFQIIINVNFISAEVEVVNLRAESFLHVDGEENSVYGEIVTGIGDYNLDGYEDFVVGGRMWSDWQGKAWVYFGNENGIKNSNHEFTIIGEPNRQNDGLCFGHTAVAIGDVNQDGVEDFGVGGPGSWGGWDVGRVYVFYGNSTSYPNFSGKNSNLTLTSPIKYDWFGETFQSAGDFNGDSFSDIIVGAPGSFFATEDFEFGLAYILFGSENGFSFSSNITLQDRSKTSGFALSMGGTGDINNDGYDDVLVGAPWFNQSQGRIYAYLGSNEPLNDPVPDLVLTGTSDFGVFLKIVKDINNDGYDEIAIRNKVPVNDIFESRVNIYMGRENISEITEPDLILLSGEDDDDFGHVVNTVGDINNDSFTDFAVGAPGGTNNVNTPGHVYVYYGGEVPDGNFDEKWTGENNQDRFGFSIGTVDVNGDSRLDVIVSATEHNRIGRVYVHLNEEGNSLTSQTSQTANFTLIFPFGSFLFAIIIKLRKRKSGNF